MKRSRLALPHKEYKELCTLVHRRDKNRCRHCKYRGEIHSHHIVFRSQGGDDTDENMISLCNECHMEGIHKRNLLIVHHSGDHSQPVNANEKVLFVRVAGWRPGVRGPRRKTVVS